VERFLIVDDDTIFAESMAIRIRKLGYLVAGIIGEAEQVLSFIQEHRPDLVFLDICIGDSAKGISLAEDILARYPTPIVFVTAYTEIEHFEKANSLQPYGYLIKPISEISLRSMCDSAVARLRAERRSEETAANLKTSIDNQRRLTDRWKRENEINAAMAELSKALIRTGDIDEICEIVLGFATRLTGSRFGYVGYIDPNTGSLINPTMIRGIWKRCRIDEKTCIFTEYTGLWGWALRNRKTLISNYPRGDERSTGVPEGHVALDRVLSVPSIIGDALLGQITLANAPEDYTEEDSRIIERMADLLGIAVQRRNYEQDVEDSELRFRSLFQNSQIGIKLSTVSGELVDINEAALSMFGMDRDQAKIFTANKLYENPEDRRMMMDELEKYGSVKEHEIQFCRTDGSIIDIMMDITPLEIAGERYLLSTFSDVTEKRRAVAALTQSEQRYRELVEKARSAILRLDSDGHVTFMNEFAEWLFELSGKDWQGKHIIGLIVPSTNSRGEDLFSTLKQLEAEGRDIVARLFLIMNENENMTSSGRRLWISWQFQLISSPEGKETGVIAVGIDITGQKLAEMALARAKNQADAANLAKSEFLANMSHEIRTPLNAIIGFSQVLEAQASDMLNENQKRYLSYITDSGNHLLEMVNDILDLSKIEARKIELTYSDFNLVEVLNRITSTVSGLADKKKIMIGSKIDDAIGWIHGDEVRIKQILYNLLSNAVKFTETGKRIGIDAAADGDEAVVAVWDEGIGIPEDKIDTLFDPFVQVRNSNEVKAEGTGLGLSITKQLVELHGGAISVESTPGKGSRFTIRIPGLVSIEASDTQDVSAAGGMEAVGLSNPGGKLLIVEDNEMNLLVMKKALESFGYSIDTAMSGEQALLLAANNTYDLVLLDIQLPGMSGVDVIRQLRTVKTEDEKTLPVIAVTAYAMKGDREKFLGSGFDEYIPKPVDIQKLADIVRENLS
jgi:PAS domain S-box-containing protein